MANMGVSSMKLIDSDGDALDDASANALKVVLTNSDTIDIGDVSIKSGDGTSITDTVSGRLDVTLDSNSGVAEHSETVVAKGISIMGEAKTIDGSVLPNIVTEGEAIRVASSRHGILYSHLTVFDGTKSAIVEDDDGQNPAPAMVNVGAEYRAAATSYTAGDATILQSDINGHLKISGVSEQSENVVTNGIGIMAEAKIVDGSILPNAVSEGEATRPAASTAGILYTCLTNNAGVKNAVETDSTTQEASPGMVNVGGEYRASPTTYSDGKATILQSDINGHLRISGSHVDDSAFALGIESGVMMMGFAGAQSVDADDAAALRCTTAGRLEVDLNSTALYEITEDVSIDDGGNSITVDNGGTFATQIDGAALTALQLIDDAIYADDDDFTFNSDKGMLIMGVNSSTANISLNDVGAIAVDEHGQVRTVQNLGEPDTFVMIDVDNAVETLSSNTGTLTDCIEIILQADESNSGYIMVGDADVADNRGIKMNAGDTFILTSVDSRLINLWGSADNQNLRCMIMRQDI